jgi:UDP-glucose 4-epimerase
MSTKKVVITGGAGFIGSHLAELLVSLDFDIIVIDNLSSGYLHNLAHVRESIHFIESHVEDFDFSRLENISAVVHLAAQTSVPYSIKNYYDSSKVNLLSSTKVIDFCKNTNTPLVYATSSAVYGGLDYGDDTKEKVELISPYAVDKYVMELYTKCAADLYGLSSMGLRFFNVYGPRQDPNSPYSGVISIFINQLIKNSPITVNGGYQTRDFVYVKDVCHCILMALHKVMKEPVCTVANVLTGRSITIDELLLILQSLIPNQSKVSHVDLPPGDPEKSGGSINKMTSLLAVKPSDMVSLQQGLEETIRYFNKTMKKVGSQKVL